MLKQRSRVDPAVRDTTWTNLDHPASQHQTADSVKESGAFSQTTNKILFQKCHNALHCRDQWMVRLFIHSMNHKEPHARTNNGIFKMAWQRYCFMYIYFYAKINTFLKQKIRLIDFWFWFYLSSCKSADELMFDPLSLLICFRKQIYFDLALIFSHYMIEKSPKISEEKIYILCNCKLKNKLQSFLLSLPTPYLSKRWEV